MKSRLGFMAVAVTGLAAAGIFAAQPGSAVTPKDPPILTNSGMYTYEWQCAYVKNKVEASGVVVTPIGKNTCWGGGTQFFFQYYDH